MTIKFLPVKCGDAIFIHFVDSDGITRNIVIDSGPLSKQAYRSFRKEVTAIIQRNEKIDLLILTHRDDDHIGGISKLCSNPEFDFKNSVSNWWINHSLPLSRSDSKISIAKAVDLKEVLTDIGKCPTLPITNESPPFNLWGVKLTILSPNRSQYEAEQKVYEKEEAFRTISAKKRDHSDTIETLERKMTSFKEDSAVANGSSIAFILEYDGKKGLFLADAHPTPIIQTLTSPPLNRSVQNPLEVDFVKVSHHGSKFNTSLDLLSLIKSNHFIFSTNGKNGHRLPDKETLVRVIKNRYRDTSEKIHIYFTEKDEVLENIFKVDHNPFEQHNFEITFPEKSIPLTFNF